jgi:hypothetical protein
MRVLAFAALLAALALAGCVDIGSPAVQASGGATPRPKTVVVSDFTISSDLAVIDHGFSTRLESSGGNYPILERRGHVAARVNDEIVATIVADLRAAGLQARPGGEGALANRDDVMLVSGRLRPKDETAQKLPYGFGPGRGGVVADMNLARFAWGAKKPLFSFSAEGARAPKSVVAAERAKNRDAEIAKALTAENTVAVRLSPEVEVQARSLGDAIAAQIVAYARTQNWVKEPVVATEAPKKKKA